MQCVAVSLLTMLRTITITIGLVEWTLARTLDSLEFLYNRYINIHICINKCHKIQVHAVCCLLFQDTHSYMLDVYVGIYVCFGY